MQETTKIKDRYGLPMTTSSTLAADRWVEGVDFLLSHEFGAEEKFKQAIEADEGFSLAYAALATLLMFQARVEEAKESVKIAQSLMAGISRREQQQVEAISLSINGQGPQSFALIHEHLNEYPRDAPMLQLVHRLYVLGCSGGGIADYRQELLTLMKGIESDYGDDWAFLAHYSFAHHEAGFYEEARRLAEHSLELRPTNAFASHSVTHVFFETGDHSGGTDFLSNWLPGYDKRAIFHVHLSWHLALFELAMGHYKRAIGLYYDDIRPSVIAKSAISLADSASLFWRLQLYGGSAHPVPWEELRDQAAPAVDNPGPAFRDAHAALVFASAGDERDLSRMIDRLRDVAEKGNLLAGEITLPLVRGIGAFAHGAYHESVQLLEPVLDQLTRIGGSHVQREVFEDTLVEAYLRAEQFDKAEDMLRTRLKQRASARDTFWLGRTQVSSGQGEAAGDSFREAVQRWQDADPDSSEFTALNRLAEKAG